MRHLGARTGRKCRRRAASHAGEGASERVFGFAYQRQRSAEDGEELADGQLKFPPEDLLYLDGCG